MTATTAPQDLVARSWNTLLKVTAIVALMAVLAIAAFAVGRTTADETSAPAATTASAFPVSDPASCGHTAHTPPC